MIWRRAERLKWGGRRRVGTGEGSCEHPEGNERHDIDVKQQVNGIGESSKEMNDKLLKDKKCCGMKKSGYEVQMTWTWTMQEAANRLATISRRQNHGLYEATTQRLNPHTLVMARGLRYVDCIGR